MKINLNPEIEIETKKSTQICHPPSVLTWGNFGLFSNDFHDNSSNTGRRFFTAGVTRYLNGELEKKKKKKEYTVTAKILAFYFLLTLFKSFFVAYFSFKLQFNFSWIYKKQEALRIGKTLIFLKFTLSNTIFVGNDG